MKYDSNQQLYRISQVPEIPKHKNCVFTQCKFADIDEEYVVDRGVQTRSMIKSDMENQGRTFHLLYQLVIFLLKNWIKVIMILLNIPH